MQNALLVGLSRQVALSRELDVVANNIANLNTSGFKADGAVFEEYLGPTARAGNAGRPASRVSFVRDRATWTDQSQGPIERTGNPLDIAIDGKGFLAVQTPRGERYTRNGALQINATGELVTTEGYRVMGDSGPIQFQSNDKDITISRDGLVAVPGGMRGKLRLVSFQAPQRLQKDGGSTFRAPDDVAPQAAAFPHVIQGAIEQSNVRGVVEMTRMVEVTRNYTQVATLLQQHGDMRRTAIERLAEVPA